MRRRDAVAGLLACVLMGRPAIAQSPPRQGIVVLDQEALFVRSSFGRQARADIEAATDVLQAENRRIEADLEAEERDLTERRASMDPGAFRTLADDFDAKVEGIRSTQDAKARAIQQQSDRARQRFQERAGPVLAALAAELGAAVILDRRQVIAAAEQADITSLALERIDAVLRDGGGGPQGPAPQRRQTETIPTEGPPND
ncbi:OmpH family outer membrane protein [Jannaschia sp. LMIT008]|uniref:OmpH family outer membrane protein n=1 Tax=Jannaschia maritima TaxID=3032585 RepID=UPI002811A09E|nr:OmpH family outer membrane protein [Jannaschia sp. LMIT008]